MFSFATAVAVIIALEELLKGTFEVNHKYLPLANVGLGIILSFLMPIETVSATIIQGVLIGLTASGLYDQTKILGKG